MTRNEFNDDSARSVRTHWFRYLDVIEPIRPQLFSYCHQLTRNVWDAEDLVQDTLLTGFGMTARGDFHGEDSPVRNIKAYLFRTATNRWLDIRRKDARLEFHDEGPEVGVHAADPTASADAVRKSIGMTSPQEFAAFLLKDVFDFSLMEVADFIGTTEGTVKSALKRARTKIKSEPASEIMPDLKQLVSKFADAINSHDVEEIRNLMAEHVQIRVCNVGGGRGRNGEWFNHSFDGVCSEYAECDGVPVVLMLTSGDEPRLVDVLRLDGDEQVTRIVDYCYAPETLQYVARQLGYETRARYYHQPWELIEGSMVPTTNLPWFDS